MLRCNKKHGSFTGWLSSLWWSTDHCLSHEYSRFPTGRWICLIAAGCGFDSRLTEGGLGFPCGWKESCGTSHVAVYQATCECKNSFSHHKFTSPKLNYIHDGYSRNQHPLLGRLAFVSPSSASSSQELRVCGNAPTTKTTNDLPLSEIWGLSSYVEERSRRVRVLWRASRFTSVTWRAFWASPCKE